jgi:hypothetical protein
MHLSIAAPLASSQRNRLLQIVGGLTQTLHVCDLPEARGGISGSQVH